jgi:hypothetical protein
LKAKKIQLPPSFISKVTYFIVGWHIFITLKYGVGVMGQGVYSAPSWISPLIQIGNRFDPFIFGVYCIISGPKWGIEDLVHTITLLALGLLRAGVGILLYFAIVFSLKYYREIWRSKARIIITVVAFFLVSTGQGLSIVDKIYNFRSELRGENVGLGNDDPEQSSAMRIAGRISSYSNVIYIIDNIDQFKSAANHMEYFYLPLQIIGSVISGKFTPELTPEKVMVGFNHFYTGHSTFMAGSIGNLLIAWFVDPWVAVMNAAILFCLTACVLRISHNIGNGGATFIGFTMILYPISSGVSYEYAVVLLNLLWIYFLTRLFGRHVSLKAGKTSW